MSATDQATQIREGEELDVQAVDQYLKSQIPGLEGQPTITQFPGGASNLTYLVAYPGQEFVLRRPPFGKKPNQPTTWAVNTAFRSNWVKASPTAPRFMHTVPTSPYWAASSM